MQLLLSIPVQSWKVLHPEERLQRKCEANLTVFSGPFLLQKGMASGDAGVHELTAGLFILPPSRLPCIYINIHPEHCHLLMVYSSTSTISL